MATAPCPKCGVRFVIPPNLAGQQIECPHCGRRMRVPDSVPSGPTTPPPVRRAPPPTPPPAPASVPAPFTDLADTAEPTSPEPPREQYRRPGGGAPGWLWLATIANALRLLVWALAAGWAFFICVAYLVISKQTISAWQQSGSASDAMISLAGPIAFAFAADRFLAVVVDMVRPTR